MMERGTRRQVARARKMIDVMDSGLLREEKEGQNPQVCGRGKEEKAACWLGTGLRRQGWRET